MKNQQGFTIIELVVVILLLGILAATALPRFIDVGDEAHAAVVKAVLGGLGTSVGLFHAQYISNGEPEAGTRLAGFGDGTQTTNSNGYPIGTVVSFRTKIGDGVMSSNADCWSVFWGILQEGVRSSSRKGGSQDGPYISINDGVDHGIVFSEDFDFQTAISGTTCYFIYTAQGPFVSAPYIEYNTITGEVTQPGSI